MSEKIRPRLWLHQRWKNQSLRAKLLIPISGLMLASLLASTLAFAIGTTQTQNQLLTQQMTANADSARQALTTKVENVLTAARLLANDPEISADLGADNLSALNGRALVTRERFELDLIQIYNQSGQARTNLVSSKLYRVSSLFDLIQSDSIVLQTVDGRTLILSRAELPNRAGSIIAGIDLETELGRIVTEQRLPVDLDVLIDGQLIGTQAANGSPATAAANLFTQHQSLQINTLHFDLVITRQTNDITQVTNAGLSVMILSTVVTTLLLIFASLLITRSIAKPIHQLAETAKILASGDLNQEVALLDLPESSLDDDQGEIGSLARAFRHMVSELRGLYQNLESKVEARTKQLATATEVARSASSSLDLDVVLRTAIQIICTRFDFYFAAVFIVDEKNKLATLREGFGEAGRTLKAVQFQVPIGSKSLLGQATATRQSQIVQDVRLESNHMNNPLLHATRSEAVIPLLNGDTLIGALDVQSTQLNAFTPDLTVLLTTLADQLAVAVHNAQLYSEQRNTAQRLAEVDRLKTQFLANMTHELRTPLNSIIGFSRVMLKGIDGSITDLQRTDLTAIHNNGLHLLSLINNVLDYSKIEADKLELHWTDQVDLGQLIRSALTTTEGLINSKPIGLQQELPNDLPLVRADSTRLNQILLNLLSNAAKFTAAGQIAIQARVVEGLGPRSEIIEPFVEVSVKDTGLGIAPDNLTKIFEPFSQVDQSSAREAEGTGLGLSITQHLIDLHGGRIWAESQLGQGSTFTFILPVAGLNEDRTPVRHNGRH